MVRPLGEVTKDIVEALHAIRDASTEQEAVNARKRAAEGFVEAREHFVTEDGGPDWAAKTGAYRNFNSHTYKLAGLDPKVAQTLRASARYHVGNVLRDRLPAEELERLGLRQSRPRERMAEVRASQYETLKRVGGGASFETSAEVGEVLALFTTTLKRVRPATVAAFGRTERTEIVRQLRALAGRATQVADEAMG